MISERQWTILLYMAGDNGKTFDSKYGKIMLMAEMTSAGVTDISEMQKVGSTDEVAILAQFDTITDAEHTYRLEVQQGPNRDPIVQTIDETNCGDPAVLRDFIVWGMNYRPAQHYLLVIWNHGMGWKDDDIYAAVRSASRSGSPRAVSRALFRTTGQRILELPDEDTRAIAADDTSMDFLTNEELKRAIAEAEAQTGQKLDIIGMDACLMSMAEVQYQLKDLADYMVASQEVEPMAGWPYTEILSRLTAEPQMSPRDLSAWIVDAYKRSYAPTRAMPQVTQTAVYLPEMERTGELIRSLVEAALDVDGPLRAAFLDARQSAFAFEDPEYLDLGDLLDRLVEGGMIEDAAVLDAARSLRERLNVGNGLVVAHSAGGRDRWGRKYEDHTHGVSIYFPMRDISVFYEDLDFTATRWADLIRWVNRLPPRS